MGWRGWLGGEVFRLRTGAEMMGLIGLKCGCSASKCAVVGRENKGFFLGRLQPLDAEFSSLGSPLGFIRPLANDIW